MAQLPLLCGEAAGTLPDVLLDLIAGHRAASPDLLGAMAHSAARDSDLTLLMRLAAHPNLDDATLTSLRVAAMTGDLGGAPMSPDERHDLLLVLLERRDHPFAEDLDLARAVGPIGLKAALSVHGHTMVQMWGPSSDADLAVIVAHPQTSAYHRRRDALRLASTDLVYARDAGPLREAITLDPNLASPILSRVRPRTTLLRELNAHVRAARRMGSTAWIGSAKRKLSDFVDYTSGRGDQAWEQVVSSCHPTMCTADLLALVIECGGGPRALRAIGTDDRYLTPVRCQALMRFAEHPATPGQHFSGARVAEAVTIPEDAEPEWVEQYARAERNIGTLTTLSHRRDLTPGALDELDDGFDVTRAFGADERTRWSVTLATHPTALPEQRTAAIDVLRNLDAHGNLHPPITTLLPVLTSGLAGAAAGRALPLSVVNDDAYVAMPGISDMIDAALDELLPGMPGWCLPAMRHMLELPEATLETVLITSAAISA